MKELLKGGQLVFSDQVRTADILIDDGKILEVGKNLFDKDATVTDVTGKLIFPGFIDAHTHFDLHVAGTVTADDFATGTRAAILGGTTTIIDFATQYPGETLMEGYHNWQKKAEGKAFCDYGFHMSITEWNEKISREIDEMIAVGIPTFKLYMTYDTQVDDKTIYQILKRLREVGGIAGVHCENSGVIEALQEEAVSTGRMGVASHPATRPADAEAEAINRLLRIAKIADAPVIVVHLTCKEGLNVIEEARARGQKVYAETCPQYLLLDESIYENESFKEAAKFVIAPPLRTKDDQRTLWRAIKSGEIQTIATDHCSFTTAQKALGINDFRKIPGGLPGVESRGVLMYTSGVKDRRISLSDICRLLCEEPAKLYGMYPKKGCIAPGSDADLVVLNPDSGYTMNRDNLAANVDYNPYEGYRTACTIDRVYLRGQLVAFNGKIMTEPAGTYIERNVYEE